MIKDRDGSSTRDHITDFIAQADRIDIEGDDHATGDIAGAGRGIRVTPVERSFTIRAYQDLARSGIHEGKAASLALTGTPGQ